MSKGFFFRNTPGVLNPYYDKYGAIASMSPTDYDNNSIGYLYDELPLKIVKRPSSCSELSNNIKWGNKHRWGAKTNNYHVLIVKNEETNADIKKPSKLKRFFGILTKNNKNSHKDSSRTYNHNNSLTSINFSREELMSLSPDVLIANLEKLLVSAFVSLYTVKKHAKSYSRSHTQQVFMSQQRNMNNILSKDISDADEVFMNLNVIGNNIEITVHSKDPNERENYKECTKEKSLIVQLYQALKRMKKKEKIENQKNYQLGKSYSAEKLHEKKISEQIADSIHSLAAIKDDDERTPEELQVSKAHDEFVDQKIFKRPKRDRSVQNHNNAQCCQNCCTSCNNEIDLLQLCEHTQKKENSVRRDHEFQSKVRSNKAIRLRDAGIRTITQRSSHSIQNVKNDRLAEVDRAIQDTNVQNYGTEHEKQVDFCCCCPSGYNLETQNFHNTQTNILPVVEEDYCQCSESYYHREIQDFQKTANNTNAQDNKMQPNTEDDYCHCSSNEYNLEIKNFQNRENDPHFQVYKRQQILQNDSVCNCCLSDYNHEAQNLHNTHTNIDSQKESKLPVIEESCCQCSESNYNREIQDYQNTTGTSNARDDTETEDDFCCTCALSDRDSDSDSDSDSDFGQNIQTFQNTDEANDNKIQPLLEDEVCNCCPSEYSFKALSVQSSEKENGLKPNRKDDDYCVCHDNDDLENEKDLPRTIIDFCSCGGNPLESYDHNNETCTCDCTDSDKSSLFNAQNGKNDVHNYSFCDSENNRAYEEFKSILQALHVTETCRPECAQCAERPECKVKSHQNNNDTNDKLAKDILKLLLKLIDTCKAQKKNPCRLDCDLNLLSNLLRVYADHIRCPPPVSITRTNPSPPMPYACSIKKPCPGPPQIPVAKNPCEPCFSPVGKPNPGPPRIYVAEKPSDPGIPPIGKPSPDPPQILVVKKPSNPLPPQTSPGPPPVSKIVASCSKTSELCCCQPPAGPCSCCQCDPKDKENCMAPNKSRTKPRTCGTSFIKKRINFKGIGRSKTSKQVDSCSSSKKKKNYSKGKEDICCCTASESQSESDDEICCCPEEKSQKAPQQIDIISQKCVNYMSINQDCTPCECCADEETEDDPPCLCPPCDDFLNNQTILNVEEDQTQKENQEELCVCGSQDCCVNNQNEKYIYQSEESNDKCACSPRASFENDNTQPPPVDVDDDEPCQCRHSADLLNKIPNYYNNNQYNIDQTNVREIENVLHVCNCRESKLIHINETLNSNHDINKNVNPDDPTGYDSDDEDEYRKPVNTVKFYIASSLKPISKLIKRSSSNSYKGSCHSNVSQNSFILKQIHFDSY